MGFEFTRSRFWLSAPGAGDPEGAQRAHVAHHVRDCSGLSASLPMYVVIQVRLSDAGEGDIRNM